MPCLISVYIRLGLNSNMYVSKKD